MGMWAGIKHALNNTLGTSNFKPLNEIVADQANITVNRIATMNQYAQIDAMFTRGCVKSVQRGVSNIAASEQTNDPGVFRKTFNISPVDANKSVILFGGSMQSSANNVDFFGYMVNGSSFKVESYKHGYGTADIYFSWQVIEFY